MMEKLDSMGWKDVDLETGAPRCLRQKAVYQREILRKDRGWGIDRNGTD